MTVSVHPTNVAPEDVSVDLLEADSTGSTTPIRGGVDFSNTSDLTDFIRVMPFQNWMTYTKTGELKSTTVNLFVKILVRNNSNTTGTICLDDLSIVTSTSTNYLMEDWATAEGNVFQGTTGTVVVYPYDSRGGMPSFSVVDEKGNAISPQPTITANSGFYSVPLSGKGFYTIKVTPPSQATTSYSASIIGATAPASTSAFGMFSVSTMCPLAYEAGGNWNRCFINYAAIRENTDGTFISGSSFSAEGSPAVVDLGFLPTNQNWQVCNLDVPSFLAAVPSGTYNSSKIYPPTDWTEYKAYVEYVLSNFPANIQYVEVMNEFEWSWGGNTATEDSDINMIFKTVHDAVAEMKGNNELNNPNLKVIGPTFAHFYSPTYPDGQSALQDALFKGGNFAGDTGLLTYVDEIAMHGYTGDTTLLEPEAEFYNRIWLWEQHQRNLATPGLTTDGTATGPLKPIHMTEYGWQDGTGAQDVNELTRAAYTSRSLIITRAMIYGRMDPTAGLTNGAIPFASIGTFALRYIDHGTGVLEPWSMLNADFTPMPTYAAYATVAQVLSAIDHAGPYINTVPTLPNDAGCNYQVATFNNSSLNASVTCLWNSSTAGASLAMHLPSTITFTAIDYMGRPVTVTSGGTLSLATTPVFLSASNFFAGSAPTKITATHGTAIPTTSLPLFSDILCPSTFTIGGTAPSLTLTAPATVGTYKIMVKVGSTWAWYTVVSS